MRFEWMALAMAAVLAAGPAMAQQRIDVANEGGIRDAWMLADGVALVAPQYPQAWLGRHDTVCLGVGYLLNPDGTTSNFTMVKGWNSATGTSEPAPGYWAAFAEAAADALKQWRFKPRPEVRQAKPVYTVATFVFGTGEQRSEARAQCGITNLAARLRELRGATGHRNLAGSDILDRLDLDPANQAYNNMR